MLANLLLIAHLVIACLWGSMLFFSFVVAPLIFIKLEAPIAAKFIRAIFPVYYLTMAILSLGGSALLLMGQQTSLAGLLVTVGIFFVIAKELIMPACNRLRDAELAGDIQAGQKFKLLHKLSVIINYLQLAAVFFAMLVLAKPT